MLNAVLCVAALGAAGGLYMTRNLARNINTVEVAGATRAGAADLSVDVPRNYLIIGTDFSGRLDPSDPVNDEREDLGILADVIMILRVDPKSERAHLLSIPRDTTMDLYPSGVHRRINAAVAGTNGPRNLIETIKRNLGISIDHFVMIDFAAFKAIVGQLGGISVYVNTPIKDDNTGLDIEETGCVDLNQDEALAYARARHMKFENEDGDWEFEPTGDPGRVERQQQFVKLLMHKAIARGIRNPSKALSMGNAVAGVVTMDEQLSVGGLIDVGGQFRTFSADDLVTQIVPTIDYVGPGGAAYQKVVWAEANPILDIYRGVAPDAPIEPRNVIVEVLGTTSDSPERFADSLQNAKFDATGDSDEDAGRSTTMLSYGPGGGGAVLTVARYLDGPFDVRYDEDLQGRQVRIELGSFAPTVLDTAKAVSDLDADMVAEVVDNTGVEVDEATGEVVDYVATQMGTTSTTGSGEVDSYVEPATSTTDGSETTTTGDSTTATDDGSASDESDGSTSTAITSDSGSSTTDSAPSTTLDPSDESSNIVGGFVPLDYNKSLAC